MKAGFRHRGIKILAAAVAAVLALGVAGPFSAAGPQEVKAASDKLQLVGTPTVYVQSGGERIFSVQVKNISGAEIKGVTMYRGFASMEEYMDETSEPVQGSSVQTTTDPVSGEDTWLRFSTWFEKSGYSAANAVWDSDEEGYTIGAGQTATLWFKAWSEFEEPGTYQEWIRFGDIHTELLGGFYPVPIRDEAYTGQCRVNVNVYNPQNAAITLGTSSNGGHDISTVPLGSTIDFGTVSLTDTSAIRQEKTYYTRNTSSGYGGDITKDEHGNSSDIKVDLDVDTPMIVQWSYDYPFGCNSHLMNGMSWSPLPAAPMSASSWQAAETGVTLDASNYVAGTYTASFVLRTTPHGVKVNGGSVHTNGVYTWPVKVTLTGNNPRIPKAPQGISASAGNGLVQLTWDAAEGTEGTPSFDIFRRNGSETNANRANLNNASFNWDDYEFVGSAAPRSDGSYLFVDGTVENSKTYTYVLISGQPLQAYPGISSAVTPKSSYTSILLAPEDFIGSEQSGGVLLEWEMNEIYGGSANDGSAMVDHFNVYRDGVLVGQVQQNAVIERNEYDWVERPAPTEEYPDATEWVWDIARTDYSWEYFAETPIPLQNYTWEVAAVSKSGVEGYRSETDIRMGATEDLVILSHNAHVYADDPPYASIGLVTADYNSPEKVTYWRAEGTSAPDTSKAPVYTYERPGYSIGTDFEDEGIRKGKTYTYTAQIADSDGNVSDYYTFRIKVPNGSDWSYDDYSAVDAVWEVVNGRSAKMNWYSSYAYDDNGDWYYTGTYRVYRNNTKIKEYSPTGQTGGTITFTDDPGSDGTYVYRVDKIINGITVRGREYTFVRNTAPVDESTLLKAPGAPVLDVRISDGNPILRWAAAESGGAAEGYHVYRRDAGELINGTYYDGNNRHWNNMRYLTIQDPAATSMVDRSGNFVDGDSSQGYLENVSWHEESCPHEYWITAYNQAGESEPSQVFRFDFQGLDENGIAIPPANEDEYAPGTPVIGKVWIDWDDEESNGSNWDTAIGGQIHVSWTDSAASEAATDRWDVRFDGISSSGTDTLHAWRAAQDPAAKKGTSAYSPYAYVSAGSSYDDYGRTASVTVTAVNSAGSAESQAKTMVIRSFPRFRALAGNESAKLEWTDLFEDTETIVNGWEIWRRSAAAPWSRLGTIGASEIEYERGADGQFRTDHNGTKNYTWTDTTVSNGRTYEYRIVAACADGTRRESTVRSVRPVYSASTEAPGSPLNFKAVKINGELQFTWDPPAEGTAQYYEVMCENTMYNGEKYWNSISGAIYAPSTTAVVQQTEAGTHRYFVYAYSYINGVKTPDGAYVWETDDIDELYPNHSNVITVSLTQEEIDGQAQSYPGEFTLTASGGNNKAVLSWTKSAGATYYEIERSSSGDDTYFGRVTLPASATSFTDENVMAGVIYTYTVFARNSYGSVYLNAAVKPSGATMDEILAAEVAALITALPPVQNITEGDAEDVRYAKEAFDDLTSKQQGLISQELRQKLADCVEMLDLLEHAEEYRAIAAPVQAMIDALPEADAITEADLETIGTQVTEARTAYEALTPPIVKNFVDTGKLIAAEARIDEILEEIAERDRQAAAAFSQMIGDLTAGEITLESRPAVDAARAAYDALSDGARAMLENDEASALVLIEELLARLEKEAADQAAADAVTQRMGDAGNIAAQAEEIRALLEDETAELTDDELDDIDALLAGLETELNGIASEYDALTPEQKALVQGTSEMTEAEQAIGLAAAALEQYRMTEEEKEAERQRNQEAADAVTALIDAIPDLSGLTADNAEALAAADTAIRAARTAYNALTPAQKALVTNAADLVAAEQEYGRIIAQPEPIDISGASVNGIAEKEYTGKPVTQNISVKLDGLTLKEGTDYTVTYSANINPGTATMTITGTGLYTGAITRTFRIKKGTVSVTGVSLNKTDADITAGKTLSLTASITPADATNQDVTWSSSDTSVASVIAAGKSCTVSGKKAGSATITVTTKDGNKKDACRVRVLFTDVADNSKYYFNPVYWAVDHNPQITSGTSDTTFSPSNPCTRAQIVTFLWKAAGAPEPKTTKNPFKDVSPSSYYYKAVLWAVENGITTGTSATTFGPKNPCTRAQSMTFLYNAKKKPASYATINFTDVKPTSYYYNAVRWAVRNGITAGVNANEFGSSRTCTRAQIVTFLNKAYQ